MNDKFYESWLFIQQHPKFMYGDLETFPFGMDIMVVKVNPETKRIDDDDAKNTLTQVWLEYGPYEMEGDSIRTAPSHDPELDSGRDTFEEAIIELAQLVKEKYGEY